MAAIALRSQVLQGLAWVGGTRLIGQVIRWGSTIFVIRVLDPSAYGLLAMATIFTEFLMLLSELGLASALVQARRVEENDIRHVQGLVLLISVGLMAGLGLSAPLIADFFGEPRLTAILYALSAQFLLAGLSVVPDSLLQREMKFRGLSLVNLAAIVTGSLATLGLAYTGYGVWALVWGMLASVSVRTIGINLIARHSLIPGFQLRRIVPLIQFGGYLTASRIIWYFYHQSDFLIVGKLLGTGALGFYSISYQLASMPMQRTSAIITQVGLPAFSRIQEDPGLAGRHYLKAVRLISFLGVPVLWGLASAAPEAVPLLLGEQWHPAIRPLQIIALAVPLFMTSNLMAPAIAGQGRVDILLWNMLRYAIVMPCAFIVGSHWGITGVSLAWATAWPAVFLFNMGRSLPVMHLRRMDLLRAILRPWLAGIAMIAAIVVTRVFSPQDVVAWYRLALLIAAGVVVYVCAALAINRDSLQEFRDLVRRK